MQTYLFEGHYDYNGGLNTSFEKHAISGELYALPNTLVNGFLIESRRAQNLEQYLVGFQSLDEKTGNCILQFLKTAEHSALQLPMTFGLHNQNSASIVGNYVGLWRALPSRTDFRIGAKEFLTINYDAFTADPTIDRSSGHVELRVFEKLK